MNRRPLSLYVFGNIVGVCASAAICLSWVPIVAFIPILLVVGGATYWIETPPKKRKP